MLRLLGLVALAFNAWMLFDAYKRKAETHWLWIIAAVPGGSLIYFFLVRMKARDAKALQKRVVSSLKGPTSVDELQFAFDESPSVANRVALAQGLFDAKRFSDALAHFEEVLAERPREPDALYGIGACNLELGNATNAIEPLRKLIDINPTYREFIGYQQLAQALERMNQLDEAVALLGKLAKSYPRLPHVVVFCDYLQKAGRGDEAMQRLANALRSHDASPPHTRKLYREWARRARRTLASAPAAQPDA